MAVTPNPKFVGGAWISREGEMEATLYIPQNRRERFEELFEGYAKCSVQSNFYRSRRDPNESNFQSALES